MWHCRMIVIAAALAMAACDGDPGNEPGPITTTDTSTGKGDDPSQHDTSFSDSGGEIINDTAVSETANNETIDTLQVACNPPFPEGTQVICSGYDCTLTWLDNCRAQCLHPEGSPWGPTGTSENTVRNTCRIP